jgi:hypothetical protein
MSATAGLLPAAAPSLGESAVELLRAALKDDVLCDLGWDPQALVVRAVLGHPCFGFEVCDVEG